METIESLKQKYDKMYHIKYGEKDIYFKKIDRIGLRYITPKIMQNNYIDVLEFYIKNYEVSGFKDTIINDDEFVLSMIPVIDRIIRIKELEIKEV